MKKKIVVAIYARKSVLLKKGDTLEMQTEICKRKALADLEREGVSVEFLEYSDEKSGYNMDRDGMKKMLSEIKIKGITHLYAYKLDRLGRNAIELLELVNKLEKMRVTLICTEDGIDTSTPYAKFFVAVLAIFAEMERTNIISRVTDSYSKLSKKGFFLGGIPPIGYESEYVSNDNLVDSKAKKLSVLKVNEQERQIVQYIFDEYTSGDVVSLFELSKRIEKMGYKTKTGKSKFDTRTIGDILRNPVYVKSTPAVYEWLIEAGYSKENISDISKFDGVHGILRTNTATCSDYKKQMILKESPSSFMNPDYENCDVEELPTSVRMNIKEQYMVVAPHYGFIDDAVWLEAQKRLDSRSGKRTRICQRHNNVLVTSDMFRCKCCGRIISHYNRPSKADKNILYPVYRCEGKRQTHGEVCQVKNINATELDTKLVDLLFEMKSNYLSDVKYIKEMLECRELSQNDEERKRISKLISEKRRKKENLRSSIQSGNITGELLVDLNGDYDNLCKEIEELETQEIELTEKEEEISELDFLPTALMNMDRATFDELSFAARRTIIRQVFSYIEWDGNNIDVHFIEDKQTSDGDETPSPVCVIKNSFLGVTNVPQKKQLF